MKRRKAALLALSPPQAGHGSNPDGLQGKSTQYGGKKTGQTACCGCEYRFLVPLLCPIPWLKKICPLSTALVFHLLP